MHTNSYFKNYCIITAYGKYELCQEDNEISLFKFFLLVIQINEQIFHFIDLNLNRALSEYFITHNKKIGPGLSGYQSNLASQLLKVSYHRPRFINLNLHVDLMDEIRFIRC